MCPPVIDDSLQFQCTFNGENVDCSKPMKNGTKIIPYCKVTHQLASGLAYPPTVLTCLPDGRWDRLFHSCVPSTLHGILNTYQYDLYNLLKHLGIS